MLAGVRGVKVKHDFCYLSNPHATELFLRYFKKDMAKTGKLQRLVEHYPSQNRALAEKIAESPLIKGVPPSSAGRVLQPPTAALSNNPLGQPLFLRGIKGDNIFVGNGATEVIQAVMQNFTTKKILVPVPTFSPYLEFAPKGSTVLQHRLLKENDFRLDTEAFLTQIKKEKPDTVVIINPNNPEGGHLSFAQLQTLLDSLKNVPTVIVDESFIHFSGRRIESAGSLVGKYPNLVVIKSLSKDFGIAGLRLGYAVMSEKRVSALLERGFLWNVSGFGEYFLDLLNRKEFLKEYEKTRVKAVGERDDFFMELSRIKEIKVYPSKANMFLVELLDGTKASDLCVRLLVKHGIYVRTCYDKVGLTGEFVRIASRTGGENKKFIRALNSALE